MSFSYLETAAEMMIWDLLNLSFDDGSLITSRMQADNKFALLRELLERPTNDKLMPTKQFWKTLKTLSEARAKIAHGAWIMVDREMPMIMSHRFSGPRDVVMGEFFPLIRLRAFIRLTKRARKELEVISAGLGLQPVASAPPPQPDSPNHQPDQG